MELEPRPQQADAGAQAGRGPSALDELREIYDALDAGEEQTALFPIAGSRTVVRYRRLLFEERVAALNSDGKLWEKNAQLLIEACDEILVRSDDGKPELVDGEPVKLAPLVEGERVTFALRPGETIPLHQALGREETDMRRSVLRLFRGADAVLLEHAGKVDGWMDTVRDRTNSEFAGG